MSVTISSKYSKTATAGSIYGSYVDWLDLTSRISVTGGYQTAVGNTTGTFNLWFGHAVAADKGAVSGNNNVGLGTYAAYRNQGDCNVWVGARAGYENVTGSRNVGLGWGAGASQSISSGNTSVGYRAGEASGGGGNVSVGERANAGAELSATASNVALGAGATARGGMSFAGGAGACAHGAGAVALGATCEARGAGSVALGAGVRSSGTRSLHIMPRGRDGDDGRVYDADGELNVYGVLTGSGDDAGRFHARLCGDAVTVSDGSGAMVGVAGGVVRLTSAESVTVAAPAVFCERASFAGRATFSDLATFSGGAVTTGEAVFEGPAVFRGEVDLGAAALRGAAVEAGSIDAGSLRVTGRVDLPRTAIPDPEFETQRTAGTATFMGKAEFRGGVHACCGNVSVEELDAKTARVHELHVDGAMFLTGAVSIDRVTLGEATVGDLMASRGSFESVSVSGDTTGTGNLYYTAAFLGELMAKSVTSAGPIMSDSLYTSNIVCDTITVTGGNTLRVLGSSLLNTTRTNTLKVLTETEMDTVIVLRDVYVGTHTDTGTLRVRDGTIMSRLTVDSLDAKSAEVDAVAFETATGGELAAAGATLCNLKSRDAAVGTLSASNLSAGTVQAEGATVCNLTVKSLTLVDGLDTSKLKLHDTVLTGTTTVASLRGQRNAVFDADVTVAGTLRAGTLEVTGGLSLSTGMPVVFEDVAVFAADAVFREDVTMSRLEAGTARVREGLTAGSVESGGDVGLRGCLKWRNPGNPMSDYQWDACLEPGRSGHADLRFRSANGTLFTLTDDFEPGVLNFTGKHRCVALEAPPGAVCENGMVYVACGGYENLDGGGDPTVDESIPVVALSTVAEDPRAFGVLAGTETPGGDREYRVANVVFAAPKRAPAKGRVVLNSVGEGGMWVCDAGGAVSPGDLLVTSGVAGHAMRQRDGVVRSSTVGKVSGGVVAGGWIDYTDPVSGTRCRRAFVGVTYKF